MKDVCCLILVLAILIPAAAMARPQNEIDMIDGVVLLAQMCFEDTDKAEFSFYYDQERDFFGMEIVSHDLIYSEYQTFYKVGGSKFEKAIDSLRETYADGMADILQTCDLKNLDVVINIFSTEREFCFGFINGAFTPDNVTAK